MSLSLFLSTLEMAYIVVKNAKSKRDEVGVGHQPAIAMDVRNRDRRAARADGAVRLRHALRCLAAQALVALVSSARADRQLLIDQARIEPFL